MQNLNLKDILLVCLFEKLFKLYYILYFSNPYSVSNNIIKKIDKLKIMTHSMLIWEFQFFKLIITNLCISITSIPKCIFYFINLHQ